jgi:hypothetical protein
MTLTNTIFIKMLSGDLISFDIDANETNETNILHKIQSSFQEYSEYKTYPTWRFELMKENDNNYYLLIKDNFIEIKTFPYDLVIRDSRGNRYTKMDIILYSNVEIDRFTVYFDHSESSENESKNFIHTKDIRVKYKSESNKSPIEIISFPKINSRKSLYEMLCYSVSSDIIPNFSDYHFI